MPISACLHFPRCASIPLLSVSDVGLSQAEGRQRAVPGAPSGPVPWWWRRAGRHQSRHRVTLVGTCYFTPAAFLGEALFPLAPFIVEDSKCHNNLMDK